MTAKSFHLRLTQAGGWFVEDEQPGSVREGAGNGDLLSLSGTELVEETVSRQGQLELGQPLLGLGVELVPIDPAPPVPRPGFGQKQIFGHGQVTAESQFLVN